jgi:hypothetical protein
MLVKQIDDVAQLFLRIDVVCPDCFEGNKIDHRGKLVLDVMVKLGEQGSSLHGERMGGGIGHSVPLS